MSVIKISALSETAIKFQKEFAMLPFAVMAEELGRHGITLFPDVQNKHIITEYLRKQGIARPYSTSVNLEHQTEIADAKEKVLEVLTAYASVKDNLKNYQTIGIGMDTLLGKNQTKKHPLEKEIIATIIRTFGEDLLDATFGATRDIADQSPLGLMDGYDKKIDDAISSGEIAVSKGNLVSTGAIVAPSDEDDYTAFEQVLAFWRSGHALMRSKNSLLLIPYDIYNYVCDAHFNKFKSKPSEDSWGMAVLPGTGGKCKMVPSNIMGNGDRIQLVIPGIMDFGMNSMGDADFVQVRNVDEDPNVAQFWIQGDYGTRYRTFHSKMFQVNDGTPAGVQLSGDYS